jgi:uncharacterized protein
MFMRTLLSAWTVMHLYVFWRLTSIPAVVRRVPRVFLAGAAILLWALWLAPGFLEDRGYQTAAGYFERLEMNWLGILFLVFVCLLLVDLVTVFGLAFRSHVPGLRFAGLLAGVTLAAVALVQGLRPPVVHDYEVRLRGLPAENDGLVIAVVSDLHVGRLLDGRWLAARVEQVRQLHPDLVILLGDTFEGDSDSERQESMKATLRGLAARHGVWAVTGNHESHGGEDAGVRFLEEAGVRVLRNQWSLALPGLALGGVDDGGHREPSASDSDRFTRVLASRPPGTAAVLLSHRPQMVEEAAAAGVGLMLSGHTHGGQIWPFSYMVDYINRYFVGRYEVAGMPLIVSRGTGTWGPRMRLWAPGEILRITLRAQ